MAAKINTQSPIGNLMYVMVTGQGKENFEGTGYDYQCCVDVPEDEANQFIDLIEDFVEDNEPKNAERAGSFYRTSEDDDTIDDGLIRFTFKTQTEFTDKKGNLKDTEVAILDAAGTKVKLPEGKLIGNGSTGRAIGTAVIWERGNRKKSEYGVSLYLNKVQIKDFIPYEGETVDAIEGGSFNGFGNDLEAADDEPKEESRSNRRSRRSRR
jgi:hypothetical protein